jgi:hypothetical protein
MWVGYSLPTFLLLLVVQVGPLLMEVVMEVVVVAVLVDTEQAQERLGVALRQSHH